MATLKARLTSLNTMIGDKLNSLYSWASSEFGDVWSTISDVINSIPTDNSELTNGAGYVDQPAKVRVLRVHKSSLTSLDEAGLKAYWDSQTFIKGKGETIIFEIDEVDYSATITSPTEGQTFNHDEDITITVDITF